MSQTISSIAIAGFGAEGQSAYRYFRQLYPTSLITIFDETLSPDYNVPDGAHLVTGKGCFAQIVSPDYDLVVRSPGVPRPALQHDKVPPLTSVTEEFFKVCPVPIIGVTGSKGKGTTVSLIHLMLTRAGLKSHIAGNIGTPALDIRDDIQPGDIVVLELSSFQLWDVHHSPHVAVTIMVESEHLDRHGNFDDYIAAKGNITRYQTADDISIYLAGNPFSTTIASHGLGSKIPYTMPPGAYVRDGWFVIDEHKICSTDDLLMVGFHNVQNACAAITSAWIYTQDIDAITATLRSFKGLDHRLKFVRELGGVKYYDDGFATTPTSAVAAIQAFDQPKVLILGGSDKGVSFAPVAKAAVAANMRAIVLIGAMRHRLKQALKTEGFDGHLELFDTQATMPQIVRKASELAQPGDVVVLSPACASFDMFKNYKDRGQQYVAAVEGL